MVFDVNINYIAVVAAAIINMAIGFVWYGPLFGKIWMKLTGRTKESMEKAKKEMPMIMGSMLGLALVGAFILAAIVRLAGADNIGSGALIGFLVWLGFVVVTSMQDVLFEKKNTTLASINMGYNLVTLLINGALLAIWM